jgi:hypothetical protein
MGACMDKPRTSPPVSPTHRLHGRIRRLEAQVHSLEETLVHKVNPGLEDLLRPGSSASLLQDLPGTPADVAQRITRLKRRKEGLNTALMTLVYTPESPESSVIRRAIEDGSLFAEA